MQPTDGQRFRNLIRGMGRMYGQEPDGLVLDAYWIALRDWEFDDFEAACAHLMASAKFMPRPAEFNALRKAGEPTPGEAWLAALADKCEPGSRAYRAAQVVGGSYRLRMADIERDLPHIQRRFLTAYAELSDVDDVRQALPNIALPSQHRELISGGFAQVGKASKDSFIDRLGLASRETDDARPRACDGNERKDSGPGTPRKTAEETEIEYIERFIREGMSDAQIVAHDDLACAPDLPARVRAIRQGLLHEQH